MININNEYMNFAFNYVYYERLKQINKFGDQNSRSLLEWLAILGEEFGELCEAINETVLDGYHPDRGGYDNVLKEASHVAAVALALIEGLKYKDNCIRGDLNT
jgi:hypothetical protein